MGNLTYVFERVERKFLLTPSQYEGMMRVLPEYMQADQYGESTILSLYLDTADSLLIRRSLEKPVYKEKLRLRSYGVPADGDNVFLEMKKKVVENAEDFTAALNKLIRDTIKTHKRIIFNGNGYTCLLYTSPSPRDA